MNWIMDLKFSLGLSRSLKKQINFLIKTECTGIPIKDFIKSKRAYLDWGLVYEEYYNQFSEKFIELFEHQYDNLAWVSISYNQFLSEKFMEDNMHKLYSLGIACKQKVSEDFIERNIHIFDTSNHWALLFRNMRSLLSKEFKEKYKHKLSGATY